MGEGRNGGRKEGKEGKEKEKEKEKEGMFLLWCIVVREKGGHEKGILSFLHHL